MTTERSMQLGMVGLGRMGSNLARRLLRDGHSCVAYDVDPDAVSTLEGEGAQGVASLRELVGALEPPRTVWIMLPAGRITERTIVEAAALLDAGDTVIDGGNSYYRDDIRLADQLSSTGIDLLDCGTSGGVFGLDRGFCLMVGGRREAFDRTELLFRSLAPGVEAAPRTDGRTDEPAMAERGYLYCGPSGAGHFVKMVHNGIEYGVMAAIAEGMNILAHADVGTRERATDAETAPLAHPEFYRYRFDLPAVAEVWRRGSVISSCLMDLTAAALSGTPDLDGFAGRVSDSGEGRWSAIAAIEEGVPATVLDAALSARFASQGEADFAGKVLSAMRMQFGGHAEKS
jgi:6-phosphogluconate dehydrogenase